MSSIRARWRATVKKPVVLQTGHADCGLAALTMILRLNGIDVDLAALQVACEVSSRGLSLHEMFRLARTFGLSGTAFRMEPVDLLATEMPALIHWGLDHYVVLTKVTQSKAEILDPSRGRRTISSKELSANFSGIIATFERVPDVEYKAGRRGLRVRDLFPGPRKLLQAFGPVLLLSLVIELLSLISPLFPKVVIDEIIPSENTRLLLLASGLTAVVILTQASVEFLRSRALIRIESHFNLRWQHALFDRLLRLKLEFFGAREIGSITAQFAALDTIQKTLTVGLLQGLMDGVLSLLLLVVTFSLSPLLGAVCFATTCLEVILRIFGYSVYMEASDEAISAASSLQSFLIESVRGIATIRLLGIADDRHAHWMSRCVEGVDANVRMERIDALFASAMGLISGLDRVAVLGIGAYLIGISELSLGTLIAFVAYREQLTSRARQFMSSAFRLRLLDVQVQRISDIARAPVEGSNTLATPSFWSPHAQNTYGGKALRVNDLAFSYGPGLASTFEGVSFEVADGTVLAIVGKSGSGKSTLLKCLVGLLQPTAGSIVFRGSDIKSLGLDRYRGQISGVLQDDHLFSGSILQNVSSFTSAPDVEWVVECCRVACIFEEVSNFPMGFQTRVGDMGYTLSGGQRQRVALARALYRKPKLLFLDEATSHLDEPTELRIADSLSSLRMTRVFVAHRPATVAFADDVMSI